MAVTTGEIDESKRRLLTTAATITGGAAIIATAVPFIKGLLPSARTIVAGGAVTVQVEKIEPEKQVTIKWRGRPVWILHRSQQMLGNLERLDSQLRDPFSEVGSQQPPYAQNLWRSIKPDYFVCVALCTHLGCVPHYRPDISPDDLGSGWLGGYFCPCHGSRFDLAGRVYKGMPAPTNLVIPPHHYTPDKEVVIGMDQQ